MSEFPPSHEDAVHYFRRQGSDNIHIRFSVYEQGKSKQIRRSTGETDYKRAKAAADKIYKRYLGRAEAGQKLSVTSFRKIASGFIDELEARVDEGEVAFDAFKQVKSRIERFFFGFFGDTAIEDIKQHNIASYVRWRKAYWTSGPGKSVQSIKYKRGEKTIVSPVVKRKPSHSTILKELNTLRSIFDYAVRAGFLSEYDKLSIKPPRGEVGRRPSFEHHEIQELLNYLLERISEANIKDAQRLKRYQLWAYAVIASSTGMRPSEIVGLKWSQVIGMLKGKEVPLKKLEKAPIRDIDVRFEIWDTKRDRPRRIVPLKSTPATILNLWEFSGKETGDVRIFADRNGDAVKGFGRELTSAFDTLGIRETGTSERRTAYSFRHYYITQMCRAGKSPAFVAMNVGTSIDMIERFYLHGDVEQYAEELGAF